ncbi:MAG TPA: ATP-binding protein [Bacilli bacterium]|nr:ATP-binding protein [Bacilli bacterium]
MNRMSYIWKYFVPSLVILVTTFVLVQVALGALHDEKEQKFSAFANVLVHQFHENQDLQQALQEHDVNLARQEMQPFLDQLVVAGNQMGASVYLTASSEVIAMAPTDDLQTALPFTVHRDHFDKVAKSGQPLYFTAHSLVRDFDVYNYAVPVFRDGQVAAIVNINQNKSLVDKQVSTIYLSGLLVTVVALLVLTFAGLTEYRREKRLQSEQANLVRWLKAYIENEDSSGDLLDAKLTLLKGLSGEFKRALHLAQYARNQKRQVLDQLPVGVLTFDNKGELSYVNPFFLKLVGYSEEEMEQWTTEQWEEIYTVSDGADLAALYHASGGYENQTVLVKRKDGQKIPFSVSARRLPEFEGQSLGVLLLFTDLSNEFALTRLEQKAHYMFNSIPLSMLLVNDKQEIGFVNPAACHLFGLQEKEFLGKTLYEAMPCEAGRNDSSEHLLHGKIDQVLQYGMRRHLNNTRFSLRGREYDLEIDLFPIFNPYTAESDGCMILIKDKTVYREWEELTQRVDAHSHYVQMAATIAHEVRNPMTSVRGFLQLLAQEIEGSTPKMYLDVMQTEIDRMNSILSEYLSMARTPQTSWDAIDLTDLVRDTFLLLEGEANYRGVSLTLDTTGGCRINGIARELKQVLINLVRNAFDAIEGQSAPGQIDISLTESDDRYFVTVRDNGCGIGEEQAQKIFTPFFTTKAMGTGLGLPVCKKIAETHGGALTVESELGKGTSFTMELPKVQE